MELSKRSYNDLTPEEQQLLTGRYGIQPRSGGGFSKYVIEYIREITDDEKVFFQERSFLSPHFLTQSLYKLKGTIHPIRVNRVLKEKIAEIAALRTNYIVFNDKIAAVVFQDRKELPSVAFRSLVTVDKSELDSKIRMLMEADMREMFDIARGNLIRFAFYKVNEDEYAVLVTMAHLIFPEINLTEFFQEFLGLSVVKSPIKSENISYNLNDSSVKSYWEKMLDKIPALPRIPYVKNDVFGKKESRVYRKKLSGDVVSELMRIAKSNRMLLMAIIESAWSILLAEFNDIDDIFFSALLPDKKANLKVPNIRAMPVRIKIDNDISVEQFVMNNFQQLIISKPYSSVQIDELHEISGVTNRLFNHFLSFYDFMEEEKEYSSVPATQNGALVLRNSWDSGPSHIGLYFQHENGSITLTLIYNANSFINSDESRLVARFSRALIQMVDDYHLPMSLFLPRLKERLKLEDDNQPKKENGDIYVRYAILSTEIFKDILGDDAMFLQRNSQVKTLFEGDRIFGEYLNDGLIFLLKGRVARNIDTGDGWYQTLDILKEKSLINITSMLKNPRFPMSVEILTDEAEVLFIKKDAIESIIRKTHFVGKNLLSYALKEMEKYQYLWMQS